jgi:glycosyltransferase involved in cell wall biosynthesis
MVKVLHIITSIDKSKGGTSMSCLFHLYNQSVNITNHIIYFEKLSEDQIDKNINKYLFRVQLKNLLSRKFLKKFSTYDIVHIHGLWQFKISIFFLLSLIFKLKIVVSAHGMLEPWAIGRHRLLKNILLELFQRRFLRIANCLCVTSSMELNNIRMNRIDNLFAIIPNSVSLMNYRSKNWLLKSTKRKIVFLSRIHPKKGVEILIEALSMLDHSILQNLNVEIVGEATVSYLNKLEILVSKFSLQNVVKFTGPKYGNDKIDALCSADLFVLPSYSENFGNVIIESLACSVPVITTLNTPWEILTLMNCGWCIENNSKSLSNTIKHALGLNYDELSFMGKNGRLLVESRYTNSIVAKEYLNLYTSL